MTDLPRQAPTGVTRSGAYWVLVPDTNGDVLVVNETGYHVFTTCDGTRTCATIAAELAAQTGTDLDQVLADVVAYVANLRAAGLLLAAGTE
jgi:hypothetical protein